VYFKHFDFFHATDFRAVTAGRTRRARTNARLEARLDTRLDSEEDDLKKDKQMAEQSPAKLRASTCLAPSIAKPKGFNGGRVLKALG
jgi:hypothetical protein